MSRLATYRATVVSSVVMMRKMILACFLHCLSWCQRHRTTTAFLLLCVAIAITYWKMLPTPLFDQPYSSILLARDGTLLDARIAEDGQWRFPEQPHVPDKFARALITYEDKRFYHHPGVDALALARAIRLNLKKHRVVSGGSTLTIQLARLQLSQHGENQERNLLNKMHEALLATRIEFTYSKESILALYASHAPFGGNVVGLDAAAWRYFGRSADTLSWAEAATLAVLPNSPALITPGRHRSQLKLKRDQLLQVMQLNNVITPTDLQLALAEPLVETPYALPELAPHLLETLHARYPRQNRFTSTLDNELQAFAMQVVRAQAGELSKQNIDNVAALIVDNQTFEVRAYVGNSRWAVNTDKSFAVDIVQRPRSTGSILKPMLYAAMLDSGQLLPQMLVADIPTQYKGYAPENFDRSYRGAVPADVALAHSLNVPAVRMLREYGVERFYDLLTSMGMSTLKEPADHYGLTLILGGAEGTLWDITQMHANLLNLARHGDAGPADHYHALRVLQDQSSEAMHQAEISPAAAWLTMNALLEVARPAEEASWKQFASSKKIAWKTGTSWGMRDAWAVGSTSRYTVGVWVGNANGEGRPDLTGSKAAAPILFELHNRLDAAKWIDAPSRTMKRVRVCIDDGYLATSDCQSAEQWVPANSHFDKQSSHHPLLHLDHTGQFQVDSTCESVSKMKHVVWFVLPPAQEFYYRRSHGNYKPLPPYRQDCSAQRQTHNEWMEFVYPNASGKIYIPIDLDGRKGRAVFEAVHRNANAVLYWHLDDEYLGSTQSFHKLSLDIAAGPHVVTIVDAEGNRLSRSFDVLPQMTH